MNRLFPENSLFYLSEHPQQFREARRNGHNSPSTATLPITNGFSFNYLHVANGHFEQRQPDFQGSKVWKLYIWKGDGAKRNCSDCLRVIRLLSTKDWNAYKVGSKIGREKYSFSFAINQSFGFNSETKDTLTLKEGTSVLIFFRVNVSITLHLCDGVAFGCLFFGFRRLASQF